MNLEAHNYLARNDKTREWLIRAVTENRNAVTEFSNAIREHPNVLHENISKTNITSRNSNCKEQNNQEMSLSPEKEDDKKHSVSYWWGGRDLNPRSPRPERGILDHAGPPPQLVEITFRYVESPTTFQEFYNGF